MSNPLFLSQMLRKSSELAPDAYLYSSARFKVRAYSVLTSELLLTIGENGRMEDILHRLAERGIDILRDQDGHLQIEESLERYLSDTYAEVENCLPNARWIALFRYPYDAHNIKTILKCRVKWKVKDPLPLLIGLGTVSLESAVEAIRTEHYTVFPTAMARAIPEAMETYSQTADPQQIDGILDSACFAAQQDLAAEYPPNYFTELIDRRIDLTNLLIAIRIGRLKNATAESLSRHLISGGTFSIEFWKQQFSKGETALLTALSQEGYPQLEKLAEDSLSLSALEKQIEHILYAAIRKSASVPAGLQVIYGYLSERELEVKNVRILLAAIKAGYTPEKIRALLRA